jgi:hypothetical protein
MKNQKEKWEQEATVSSGKEKKRPFGLFSLQGAECLVLVKGHLALHSFQHVGRRSPHMLHFFFLFLLFSIFFFIISSFYFFGL